MIITGSTPSELLYSSLASEWVLTYRTFLFFVIIVIIIISVCGSCARIKRINFTTSPAQRVSNVQPEITDSFRLVLNVTVPNCSYWQLVILVIEDYALCRVDNRTALSLAFLIQRGRDAHKATRLAMFPVIICHRWLGLSRNCRESKLSRERAKRATKRVNCKGCGKRERERRVLPCHQVPHTNVGMVNPPAQFYLTSFPYRLCKKEVD